MNETNQNPAAASGGQKHEGPGSECPEVQIWLRVAAGALEPESAIVYLQHAAGCPACAQELKQALALFSAEESAEERALLDRLRSTTDMAQAALVDRLVRPDARVGRVLPLRGGRPSMLRWLVPAGALIAAALLLAVHTGYRVWDESRNTRLLAAAYSADRTSELRLPGSAATALVSPTRGDSDRVNESADLLELKLRAEHAFERNPNDAAVRQTLGQIALVEHKGEAARREFEMAEVLDPKLPRLKLDLGAAYFELAETGGQQLDYARAIDYFSQYLASVQDQDAVALYDRGLCWERQSVYSQAEKDFAAALKLEKEPGWRSEMQKHLDRVKSILDKDSTKAAPRAAFSPAALLRAQVETPGLYEMALSAASREWLPKRGEDAQIDRALARTAQLGLGHQDRWLSDMLATRPTEAERTAETWLARALTASASGNADATLIAATEAMTRFAAIRNRPGYVRAALERVSALHQSGRARDGVDAARSLLEDRDLARYAWLAAYLRLEYSGSLGMEGDLEAWRRNAVESMRLSREADLPLLSLRCAQFLIDIELRDRHLEAAWRSASREVLASYKLQNVAMRRSTLLSFMANTADDLNLPWTRAELDATAAEEADHAGNAVVAGYAYEQLAMDQLHLHDSQDASTSFAKADSFIKQIQGGGGASALYQADWQANRSAYEAERSGPATALRHLASMEPELRDSTYLTGRVVYYTQLSDLLRRTQHFDESLAQAWIAVAASEHLLAGARTDAEREAWRTNTERAYKVLTLGFADAGKPELALRAWEWMRTASRRSGQPIPSSMSSFEQTAPSLPAQPADQLTLVYAELEGRYVGWAIRGGAHPSVAEQTLPVSPEELQANGRALLRLCSDPHSSVTDIRVLGAALDRALLAPFASDIAHSRTIALDLDPSLAQIPFAAVAEGDRFFGLAHQLLYLPGDWLLLAGTPDHIDRPFSMVVLREEPAPGKALIPDEYDESIVLKQRFAGVQVEPVLIARDGAKLVITGASDLPSLLAQAEIVHYTGHGLSEQAATPAGTLDPQERTVLTIAPATLRRCQLAVLAACRTSSEREESQIDVPSFARILLAAGAARVLATQWDVDSRRTQGLMVRFYQELADHQTYLESLRRAQETVESDMMSAHPYFWASFQLVGRFPSAH